MFAKNLWTNPKYFNKDSFVLSCSSNSFSSLLYLKPIIALSLKGMTKLLLMNRKFKSEKKSNKSVLKIILYFS